MTILKSVIIDDNFLEENGFTQYNNGFSGSDIHDIFIKKHIYSEFISFDKRKTIDAYTSIVKQENNRFMTKSRANPYLAALPQSSGSTTFQQSTASVEKNLILSTILFAFWKLSVIVNM